MTLFINYLAEFGFILFILGIILIPAAVAIWVVENHLPQEWIDKFVDFISEEK